MVFLLLLCGCGSKKSDNEKDRLNKYEDMIELVRSYDSFLESSDYFEIDTEVTKLNEGGYRFYVIIEKARVAMYDVEAIAIEKNVDYSSFMAANVGIFEDRDYTMIPNQSNPDKGYVAGIVMSGLCNDPETSLYMLIQWKSKDMSTTKRQFLKLDIKYYEDNYDENAINNNTENNG